MFKFGYFLIYRGVKFDYTGDILSRCKLQVTSYTTLVIILHLDGCPVNFPAPRKSKLKILFYKTGYFAFF